MKYWGLQKYKITLRAAYTSPSDISKESEGTNQSTNDLPDVSSQEDSEGTNQTGNGVQGGVLGGETGSESTNQTDGGVTDDEVPRENTNQTGETEDQTNNQDVNIQNNIQMKQRLDIIISEETLYKNEDLP